MKFDLQQLKNKSLITKMGISDGIDYLNDIIKKNNGFISFREDGAEYCIPIITDSTCYSIGFASSLKLNENNSIDVVIEQKGEEDIVWGLYALSQHEKVCILESVLCKFSNVKLG